jgi:hypothetical protein
LDDNLDPIAADPPGPEWVRDWLGIDYLATVRGVTINQLSDDSMEALRALTGLRSLQIQPLMIAAPPVFSSGPPAIDAGPSIAPVMSLLPSFTLLEKLVLTGAPATDGDLAVLAKLPRLRILDLSGCPALTDAGLAHVGKIAGLKSLSVWGPVLTEAGLEKLGGLRKLETLRLDLQDQPLGLNSLNGLSNLEELQLSRLTDASFTSLSGAPKLKKLSLVQCQQLSSAGLKHVGDFRSLEVLYFALMPGLDDDALARIAELPKLRELVIQGQMSRLSDSGLEALSRSSSLRTLFLFGCPKLTDEGLAHLAALKNIGQINLEGYQPDQFSSQAVDDLRAGLPKCRFHFQTAPPASASPPPSAAPSVFYPVSPPTPLPSSGGSPPPAGP